MQKQLFVFFSLERVYFFANYANEITIIPVYKAAFRATITAARRINWTAFQTELDAVLYYKNRWMQQIPLNEDSTSYGLIFGDPMGCQNK